MSTGYTVQQFVESKLGDVDDVYEAARDIEAIIPCEQRHEFTVQLLIPVISAIIGARRRAAFDAIEGGDDEDIETVDETGQGSSETHTAPAGLVGTPIESDEDEGEDDTQPPVVQNFARRNRHRAYWLGIAAQKGLAAGGGTKLIREMTLEDIEANVLHRRRIAAGNLARADEFERIGAMMRAENAVTVGDLAVMRDEAA